ncbi:MAG: AsnC family transcriptional regulator [Desulfurococcales archaeon ex4484_217_1]|nr:MAG: AsnC family transcriptional regulator [Desulfurococcales archaeon ex4484_217_1]
MVELDDLDKKIIAILQTDGRIPFSRLAQALHVSESTIYLRIKKLREAGILKGFSAIIDYRALGKNSLAYVLVKTSPRQHQRVLKVLSNIDNIYEIYDVTGEYQVLLRILAENRVKLGEIVNRVRRVNGVREVYVLYVLNVVKEERAVRV